MRIVHFSDLHLQPDFQLTNSQRLMDKMIEALSSIELEKKIDLIIFSGDIIDKGGKGFGSLERAFKIFDNIIATKLLESLGLRKEQLLFVPGNHDVDRDADSENIETGLSQNLNSIQKVDDFIRDPKSLRDVRRIEDFKRFQKGYYFELENIEYKHTPFQSNIITTIDGLKIGITLLNSVWRCYDSNKDKGNILIGEAQILDSIGFIKNCDIKIAVSHHDYNWVKDFERPNLPKLITKNYNMFFCGHTHGADTELICRPEGNTFFFTAPGLLHANVHEFNSDYKNGFMVVDYDIANHNVGATKYIQDFDQEFRVDKNYGDNGIWKREIPRGEVAIRNEKISETYSHIGSLIPGLNAHLIGYRTSTNSPKDINNLFVMPNLQYKEHSGDDIESVKNVEIHSISELLSLDGNIIIYGDKESGKTILLDKILIDVSNQYRTDNMIPAVINFTSIKKNIVSLLSTYWDQRSKDTISILQEKNVILLIDNIDFSDENSDKIECIIEFLKKYPKIKLIGTSRGRNSMADYGPSDQIIPSVKTYK